MTGSGGAVVGTRTALARVVNGPARVVRDKVGRRAPGAVAPRSLGSPTVAGATALALVAAAPWFGHRAVLAGPVLCWLLALKGLRHVPVAPFVALVLPGLTDPSLLFGV